MRYWTKHFDGFDVEIDDEGQAFILSETEPDTKPMIGPFKTPAQAIEFGLNRVEKIK